MVYISASGSMSEKRSNWRLSIVSDFFWAIVNFFGLLYVSGALVAVHERCAPPPPRLPFLPSFLRSPLLGTPSLAILGLALRAPPNPATVSTPCLWCVRARPTPRAVRPPCSPSPCSLLPCAPAQPPCPRSGGRDQEDRQRAREGRRWARRRRRRRRREAEGAQASGAGRQQRQEHGGPPPRPGQHAGRRRLRLRRSDPARFARRCP